MSDLPPEAQYTDAELLAEIRYLRRVGYPTGYKTPGGDWVYYDIPGFLYAKLGRCEREWDRRHG